MSNEKQVDSGRRFLLGATCVAGGAVAVGTGAALVSTFQPSEKAKAAGAPVEVDIAGMAPGEQRTVRLVVAHRRIEHHETRHRRVNQ